MIVLAIDTAGVDCSAAVYDGVSGRLLSAVTETIGKGHAERLMAIVDQALAEADLPLTSVQRVVVCIGPGSFTGVRVGVAAARGLALALGIECVGVTTLEALAAAHLAQHRDRPVVAAMDAKRNEVYAQAFSPDGVPLDEPAALSPEDAATLVASRSADVTGSWRLQGEPVLPDRFDISVIAKVGALKPKGSQKPKPLYLRGPDAKPQTGFALARQQS